MYSRVFRNVIFTDFRIFRPLRDDPCDSRRSKLFFFFEGGGGMVGYCMMIEIAQMP